MRLLTQAFRFNSMVLTRCPVEAGSITLRIGRHVSLNRHKTVEKNDGHHHHRRCARDR